MQVTTLKDAHKLHPTANWWIKGDGCDVVSGLEESVRLEWHGDIDFGTGELQAMYKTYRKRLKCIDTLKCNLRESRVKILQFLNLEQEQVGADNLFVREGKYLCIICVISLW